LPIILLLWVSSLIAQIDTAYDYIVPLRHIIQDGRDSSISTASFRLRWTAPGDDGNSGTAAVYDIRALPAFYGPIDTQEKWNAAYRFINEPTPSPAGQIDSMTIIGLPPGTGYYFGIRAFDDANNLSALSNSPLVGDTLVPGYIAGDINNSGTVSGVDAVFFLSCLKGSAAIPEPQGRADINGLPGINGLDLAYLVAYFRGGPPPQYPSGNPYYQKNAPANADIIIGNNGGLSYRGKGR